MFNLLLDQRNNMLSCLKTSSSSRKVKLLKKGLRNEATTGRRKGSSVLMLNFFCILLCKYLLKVGNFWQVVSSSLQIIS